MGRLLVSVNIFAETAEIDGVISALQKFDNVEEVYEVTGEYDIVTLVSAKTLEEFRDLLNKQILKIHGVKSTISTIILYPHKGRRCPKNAPIKSTV